MKLLYITNIPAPYRNKRFNAMAEIFPSYGIEFEVLYMAAIEPGRSWVIPPDSFRYPYKIYKGIHPTISNFYAHFNPGLLIRLLKNDYDIAIIGGMASPTHWLTPFFISREKIKIMSIESNLQSVQRKSGVGAWVKRRLLSMVDAYQITGFPQKEYIEYFLAKPISKPFIMLPNLIDDDVFVVKVDELRINRFELRRALGVSREEQLWVLPARMIEIKGIVPFINLLKNISGVKLFIIGEGELRDKIRSVCEEKNVSLSMPGFVQQDEIIKYYAAADLFVLPSLKDASPLTPIEACAAGLPLLVSSRIGNLDDVVASGINGWSYDPISQPNQGKYLVEYISRLSHEQLSALGVNSRNLYYNNFHTKHHIEMYANNLRKIVRARTI